MDADPSKCHPRPAYCRRDITVQHRRIHDYIDRVVLFLLEALLKPESDVVLRPDTFVRGDSNYYYVMLTIWYVAQNLQQPDQSQGGWNLAQAKVDALQKYLPDDNCNFPKADRNKVAILKWCHYASILCLHCQRLLPLPATWKRAELEAKVARLEMMARVASAMQLSSSRPYQAEDEIFDRLTLIAGELGFKYANYNAGNIASFSVRRIAQRIPTRVINPGWCPPHEDHPTSAPWEVHALCHHSQLMAFLLDPDRRQGSEEIGTFNDRLSHFLNTEGTLVACWERAYSKASRGWLRSETTAVVASTIIDVLAPQVGTRENTMDLPAGEYETSDPAPTAGSVFRGQLPQPEKTLGEASSPPPIEWAAVFAPPKKYHPDAFVLSLSDTPYAYRKKVLQKRIAVPSTLEHFGSECPSKFTRETLQEALKQSLVSVLREYHFHIVTPPKPWRPWDYNAPPEPARTPASSQDLFESSVRDVIRPIRDSNLPLTESQKREERDYANFISVIDIVDSVVDRDVNGFGGLKESARYRDNGSPQPPNRILDRLSRSVSVTRQYTPATTDT